MSAGCLISAVDTSPFAVLAKMGRPCSASVERRKMPPLWFVTGLSRTTEVDSERT
jgi:hypothetical protein